MGKLFTHTILTGAMGFTGCLIKIGERIVAFAEGWELHEANELRAGFVELSVWRSGRVLIRVGEWLELFVNAVAMKLGYGDGEVSGMVA